MSRIWEHRCRDEITISADRANKTRREADEISCCIGRLEFSRLLPVFSLECLSILAN